MVERLACSPMLASYELFNQGWVPNLQLSLLLLNCSLGTCRPSGNIEIWLKHE